MKLPIQSAPGGNVFLLAQFAHILTQHVVGFIEVLFGKMRYRQLQDFWLEQAADGKQFSNVIRRQRRNDRAAVGNDGNQTFGIQLTQGFTDRNATDSVLRCDGVLAELSSFRNFASNDLIAQLVGYGGRQRLAGNAGIRCAL